MTDGASHDRHSALPATKRHVGNLGAFYRRPTSPPAPHRSSEQTIEGGHGRVETLCGPRLEANLAFMPVEFDVTPGHSRYRR